ncbi:MAG: amidohydrolase family protein [Victivallales bacterium]|nr:amidohydrolase family protein [Victivallales bacterium]
MEKRTFLRMISMMMAVALANAEIPVVDVHSHFTTDGYLELLKRYNAQMDEFYPIPEWSPTALRTFAAQAGIGVSVLTSTAPQPHFGDPAESVSNCREMNEEIAKLAASSQGSILWCATLPLPSVPEAIAEAERAFGELGAAGVKLPTNACGLYLGAPELDPLMEVLHKRKAVVILHPHRPEPFNAALAKGLPLAMYEYPAETTRALARLFARNVPARYPEIRFVVPHAGAFLPLALPRMKAVHPIVHAKGLTEKIDWDANMKSFWFDLAGSANAESVRKLLDITTEDHILYGSDFPYAPANALTANLSRFRAELEADPQLQPIAQKILCDNALRLFRIEPKQTSSPAKQSTGEMLTRIAEIEVFPQYLEAYLAAASSVGAESVAKESGVLCIFPMQRKETPNQIRIVEIYRNEAAYQFHLNTPHFKKYKEGTLHMVKSLDLVPMNPLDAPNMNQIFRKQP